MASTHVIPADYSSNSAKRIMDALSEKSISHTFATSKYPFKLIFIDSNANTGQLMLQISSTTLQAKKMAVNHLWAKIIQEFYQFKQVYQEQFVPVNDFLLIDSPLQLIIGIPVHFYSAFIYQLAEKNYLPMRYKSPNQLSSQINVDLSEKDNPLANELFLGFSSTATSSKPHDWY